MVITQNIIDKDPKRFDPLSVEVMAPAGSYESLVAAINAGADSVYFGIEQLNMRAKSSNNFTIDDLKKIVKLCQEKNVKSYLTLNTILYDHDIKLMHKICDAAKEAGITAAIMADIAAIQYAHSIGLEIHLSTQVNITNIEGVKFYSKFADVIVLARELTLKQIEDINREIIKEDIRGPKGELMRIEIFAHGAMCVAISGKCYMSLATENSSANRGACTQNCRKGYRVIDEETGEELKLDNKYIMSPKDLSTIKFLDKILAAGVNVFKIEGRGRSPDYVHKVIIAYKTALQMIKDGTYTTDSIEELTKSLGTVFNRGFWDGGYYLGKKLGEWAASDGSQATLEKFFVGKVTHYFKEIKVLEMTPNAYEINVGDKVIIVGPTTGLVEATIDELRNETREKIKKGIKGELITFKVKNLVRENDKVYVVKDRVNKQ